MLIKAAGCYMHGHGSDLVWFGYSMAHQANKRWQPRAEEALGSICNTATSET